MPRKGESIFKRKDGRYEARYPKELNIYGKIIKYGFIYGKTYSEVKRKRIATVRELKNKKNSSLKNINKLEEEMISWLNSKTNIKESTYYNYLSIIKGRIIPYFNKSSKIDNDEITKFITYLKKDNLKNKRIKEILLLLQQFLKYKNILIHITMPTVFKNKIITFTDDEIKTIEKYIFNSSDELDMGIILVLFTGIRLGELCALKWKDIDFDNNIIRINKTLSRIKNNNDMFKTIVKITSPKSETSIREVPINKNIKSILIKFKATSCDNYYILTNNDMFISTNKYYYYYKNLLKKLNIEYKNFHVLRHTFATRALSYGMDIKTLSEILGHNSVKITLDLYVHITIDEKIKQINKIPLLINNSQI